MYNYTFLKSPLNYKNAFPVFHEIKHEISGLVSRGFTNEKIAKRLDISEPTVKTHLTIYIQKLIFTIELIWLFVF